METITLYAYGKINLALDVIGRRPNGYHDVRMIMQSVGVRDTLTIKRRPLANDIRLISNFTEVPNQKDNLAVKAAALLKKEFSISEGMEITLTKRIPVAAGMAGGSTDAAAALKAVNTLFSLNLTEKQLAAYGVSLGADVPYCLLSGTALSEGIGEILTPLSKAPECHVLLVNPRIPISTKDVYEHLDAVESLSHPDIDGIIAAISRNDYTAMTAKLENILESVVIPKNPVIAKIKETMLSLGADGALMSGSGATVFGLFSSQERCHAAAWKFRAENSNWYTADTVFV